MVVEIFEQENRGVNVAEDGVEARDWVACIARSRLALLGLGAELNHTLAARPDVKRLVPLLGDLEQPLLEPLFFPRHNINDRVASADKHLELVRGSIGGRGRLGLRGGSRRPRFATPLPGEQRPAPVHTHRFWHHSVSLARDASWTWDSFKPLIRSSKRFIRSSDVGIVASTAASAPVIPKA